MQKCLPLNDIFFCSGNIVEVNRARLSCQRYEDFKIFILFAELEEIDWKEIELVSKELYYCIERLCELSTEFIKGRTLDPLLGEQEGQHVLLNSNAIGLGASSTAWKMSKTRKEIKR